MQIDRGLVIQALRKNGWAVQPSGNRRPLPAHINTRYPAIPPVVRDFLEGLDQCVRGDEKVWFLTPADYSAEPGSSFVWNEWEKMEAEESEALEVRAFWDHHFPILHSVAGDYAFLAVCVDPASPAYGNIVRGDAPEFRETVTICESFEALLRLIEGMRDGHAQDKLADLFLDPAAEGNLRSEAEGLFERIANRVRRLALLERYRIGVVVETRLSRPLWHWENWRKIIPPMTAVTSRLSAEAVIRPRQSGDRDNWLPFGRLPWSDKNNRTWTTKYLTDPNLVGKVQFFATEIWAPSRAIAFESRRGPELFCLLDYSPAANSQGFVLAIRKDVLGRVDVAADAVVFAIREQWLNAPCVVFDRRWGEQGRFGSTVVTSGLDWTSSTAVLEWAQAHPKSHVRSFRWRRSMG